MNPQIQAKLDELQRQIDAIKNAKDLVFVESVKKRVVNAYVKKREEIEAADASLTKTVNVSATPTSFDVPEVYDVDVVFEIDGNLIRLGGYNV